MYFSLAYGVTCKKLCSYLSESEPLQHYHVTFSKPRLSRHIFQDEDVGYTPCCDGKPRLSRHIFQDEDVGYTPCCDGPDALLGQMLY
ncbi:hypothetical protein F2Q70_00007825 [Brassica cretica]|uniref:Uncharacterized protein n=1 Tax=Brassica cretica TaxID=69181 RepID=A0A8S9M8D8_BRACR|nr:hypothetical protein F2Q70_00007825 [Brassica cretica]